MFDFPFQEPSVITVLYCLLSYIFVVRYGYVIFVSNHHLIETKSFPKVAVIIICLLVSTHAINGDFFHLMKTVQNYDFTVGAYVSQEKLYPFIAKVLDRNYLLFRIVLWSFGFYLLLKSFKLMGLNQYLALWVFLSCYMVLFVYARAAIAAAVYFAGLILVIRDKQFFMYRVIGLLFIIASLQFHRSMLVLVLLTPLVFLPVNKKTFYVAICSMPFIIVLVRLLFSNALNELALLDDEILEKKFANYSEGEGSERTIRERILNFVNYATVYIPFIYSCYYIILRGQLNKINNNIKYLFNYTFWLISGTTAISYVNEDVDIFFYRMLYMAIIPSTIIFVYLIQKRIINSIIVKRVLYICFFYQIISYLYMLYLNTR